MPTFIANYDIKSAKDDLHSVLLDLAPKYGYEAWALQKSGEVKRLPNTTLIGKSDQLEDAHKAFKRLLSATSKKIGTQVVLEKLLLSKTSGSTIFVSDEPKPKKDDPIKLNAVRLIKLVQATHKK